MQYTKKQTVQSEKKLKDHRLLESTIHTKTILNKTSVFKNKLLNIYTIYTSIFYLHF